MTSPNLLSNDGVEYTMVVLDDSESTSMDGVGPMNGANSAPMEAQSEPFGRNIAWQGHLVNISTMGIPGLPSSVTARATQVGGLVLPDEYNKKLLPYSTVTLKHLTSFKVTDATLNQFAALPASSVPSTLGMAVYELDVKTPETNGVNSTFDVDSALATKLRMYRSDLRMDPLIPTILDSCIVPLDRTSPLPNWLNAIPDLDMAKIQNCSVSKTSFLAVYAYDRSLIVSDTQ